MWQICRKRAKGQGKILNTKWPLAVMETSHPGIVKESTPIKPSDFSLLLATHEASFWSQARQLRLIGKESRICNSE